eukprot:Colp12_sorted_trinity150504_noHs@25974
MAAFTHIPVVDLLGMDDPLKAKSIAAELGQACENVGFFYVKNHGVPQFLIDSVRNDAKFFFDNATKEEKREVSIKNYPKTNRGYTGLLEECVDPTTGGDLKESLDFGISLEVDNELVKAGVPFYGPNPVIMKPETLNQRIDEYIDVVRSLAQKLCRLLAMHLGWGAEFFDDKFDKPLIMMRIIRYPPVSEEVMNDGKLCVGCGAHTDYGCLTILHQDDVGGLQVQNTAGQWVDAEPIPGTFVVNLGDMMQRWTNDRVRATRHRVTNSQSRERYSIPLFYEPNYHAVVECQAADGSLPRYPPIEYGPYLASRFSDTYTVYREAHSNSTGH